MFLLLLLACGSLSTPAPSAVVRCAKPSVSLLSVYVCGQSELIEVGLRIFRRLWTGRDLMQTLAYKGCVTFLDGVAKVIVNDLGRVERHQPLPCAWVALVVRRLHTCSGELKLSGMEAALHCAKVRRHKPRGFLNSGCAHPIFIAVDERQVKSA